MSESWIALAGLPGWVWGRDAGEGDFEAEAFESDDVV